MLNPWEQKFRPGSPGSSSGLNVTKCSFEEGPRLKNRLFQSKIINSKIPALLSRLPAPQTGAQWWDSAFTGRSSFLLFLVLVLKSGAPCILVTQLDCGLETSGSAVSTDCLLLARPAGSPHLGERRTGCASTQFHKSWGTCCAGPHGIATRTGL